MPGFAKAETALSVRTVFLSRGGTDRADGLRSRVLVLDLYHNCEKRINERATRQLRKSAASAPWGGEPTMNNAGV